MNTDSSKGVSMVRCVCVSVSALQTVPDHSSFCPGKEFLIYWSLFRSRSLISLL